MDKWQNKIIGYDTKPADQFQANPLNFRTHPTRQRKAMRASLDDNGWVAPVIENQRTGHLLDGHERVWQALKNDNAEVPYLLVDVPEEDEGKVIASLDPIAVLAEIDKDKLDEVLQGIQTDNADLMQFLSELAEDNGLYFGEQEEQEDPGAEIDKAEELREKWGVESGQLWRLGEHRVICGDCTDKAVVDRLMGGERAQMCFTSPPYNKGFSKGMTGNTHVENSLYIGVDNDEFDDYYDFLYLFTKTVLEICDYVFVNVQMLANNKRDILKYWFVFNDNFSDVAIWDKQRAAPAAAERVMDSAFEFILIFSKHGKRTIGTRNFRGMVHNVYRGQPNTSNEFSSIHAAGFPLDLPEYFIKTFSNENEYIMDTFLGTGTTLIACQRLNRRCYGIEIEPKYVAVTLERWHQMTGEMPELLTEPTG